MSNRKERMALARKANQKARMAPLHAEQAKRRETERAQVGLLWAKRKARGKAA